VAIPLPGRDKVPDGPVREFVSAVHEIYDAAGQPAARVVARATLDLPTVFHSVSHETVSATLRGSGVPAWEKVRAILQVLALMAPFDYEMGPLEQRWSDLWQRARHVLQDAPEPGGPAPLPPDPPPPPFLARPAQPAPVSGARPRPEPGFVGREALLESMRAALAAGPDVRLVLHGPVGAGKTQAALSYLDRHVPESRHVWWVPCESVDGALACLIELAGVLGVERHHRVSRTVRMVLDGLEQRRFPYLMIFDGLDDPGLLRLVPNGGQVIVTTRDPALGAEGSSVGIEVPDLDPGEVEELLREQEKDLDADRVHAAVAAYGCSPLAVRQVLAWWRETGTPVGVLDGADPADRLDTVPADGYGRNASLTLLFALDRLEQVNPPALALLETLVCFARTPVSKELLGRGASGPADDDLADLPRGEVALNKIIGDLRRHGLVRFTGSGRRVEVLPLVRLVVRRALAGADAARARRRAHALLAAADPGWPDDQPSAELYREIAAHVDATGLVTSTVPAARRTVYHQIRFRYLSGDYAVACELGERAYTTWLAANDPAEDDHLVLRTAHEWANALRAAGEYTRAGDLTRIAMGQLRVDPEYGESHRYTLAMAAGRAADLRIAGDYRRALEVDEETFALSRASFGDDHPRTTMSRHNHGISLRLTGDFRTAEQVDRTALSSHREIFGEGNWRTLLSVNALAEDLNGQGRYQDVLDEVEPMLERVAGHERTRRDRGLLLAQRALALARRGIGRHTEALALLEESYAECASLFGERHEYSLALRMSRANTLHLLGRADEAAGEALRVFEDYSRLFGPSNPLAVAAEINLASTLRALGEHSRALRIDIAGSESLIDRVGPGHPFSVAAAVNLASDYACGGHPNMLAASRRAVALAQQVHAHLDHPDVMAAEANLAIDLAASAVPAALASRQRQEVLQRLVIRFGQDHPLAAIVARGGRVDCVLEPPGV
jgi:tetratricopeptide (TPR) repeat protein